MHRYWNYTIKQFYKNSDRPQFYFVNGSSKVYKPKYNTNHLLTSVIFSNQKKPDFRTNLLCNNQFLPPHPKHGSNLHYNPRSHFRHELSPLAIMVHRNPLYLQSLVSHNFTNCQYSQQTQNRKTIGCV